MPRALSAIGNDSMKNTGVKRTIGPSTLCHLLLPPRSTTYCSLHLSKAIPLHPLGSPTIDLETSTDVRGLSTLSQTWTIHKCQAPMHCDRAMLSTHAVQRDDKHATDSSGKQEDAVATVPARAADKWRAVLFGKIRWMGGGCTSAFLVIPCASALPLRPLCPTDGQTDNFPCI